MKIAMVYARFMNSDGQDRSVGGIQTYLFNLGQVCSKHHHEPIIYQAASRPFKSQVGPISVVGVPVSNPGKHTKQLVEAAASAIDLKKDLLIFGADRYAMDIGTNRCISIQHGIEWDLLAKYGHPTSRLRRIVGDSIYQVIRRRRAIKAYLQCPNRVCVDYNFLNWLRTFLVSELPGRDWVILNSADIAPEKVVSAKEKNKESIEILFARRFHVYRGTRIMAEAAKRLLAKHGNIEFTFAGEGPDETWLKNYFSSENRVQFIKYKPEQSLDVHLQHDIAVIPSLASEGSSLSVSEAMGAGCAVVATAVGGITNMIINGYNGFLCIPTANDLEKQIEILIADDNKRLLMGTRAYDTAKEALSLDKWEESWAQVIEEVTE
ncbi:MAG: glycosyltransferase family 4 protein [Syntrophales bacterium]|jgi:glycosyltransferase involved in cell wall biosynthesis|nr:glycosyltransferase family 4 protein [Syntrophales bacterium]